MVSIDQMESTSNENNHNLNPWPNCEEQVAETNEATRFEDNFINENGRDLNKNGLQLPDSEHYLAVLGLYI